MVNEHVALAQDVEDLARLLVLELGERRDRARQPLGILQVGPVELVELPLCRSTAKNTSWTSSGST